MKALTVYQPWASLIALRQKRIETRSWKTNYRGPLAIHAAQAYPHKYRLLAKCDYFADALRGQGDLYTGVILAVCNLVDCVKMTDSYINALYEADPAEYAFGYYDSDRYAWILEDVKRLVFPIPAKGKQGLWNWEPPTGFVA